MITNQLEIRVVGAEGESLEGANVIAVPEGLGNSFTAQYDPARQLYFMDGLRPGFFAITVERADYEPERRRIQVQPKPTQISFILVKTGSQYTFRGNQRVPFTSQPELIGIIPSFRAEPAENANADEARSLSDLLDSLGLVPERIETADEAISGRRESSSIPGAVIVRRTQGVLDADQNEDLKTLRTHPSVAAAGPVFRVSGRSFSVFTNQLFVKFRPEITRSEIEQLLANEGLTLVRPLEFAPNLFVVEADASIGEAINQIAERLLKTERVEYAEPQMAEVPELDSITPTDYLWPGIWDRQLVQTQDAWQLLRDEPTLGEPFQFGRPSIIIAVIDTGIKSVGGVPENPDFQGTVSDGSSKTYQLFDFGSLVPHHNTALDPHGVSCAGVAAGIANNPSPDPTVGIGVAGAAPNARLIGLRTAGLELWNLEMFLWAAGLHPQSSRAGFPAPINPGTDIFTCSLGLGFGAPLSHAAEDMFDYITSRGRGGKGCVAIFSSGNVNSEHIGAPDWYRPYGTYERSFACSASTLNVTFARVGGVWTPSAATPTTVSISNPVTSTGAPATGHVAQAIFNGNLQVRGEFKQIQIQVHVSDLSGNVTPAVNASRLIDVAIPTDLALLLDYSGSMLQVDMAGHSKWNSAKEAGNLFNTIYAALALGALDERIALIRFFTDGFAGPDLTEVTEGLAAPTTAMPLVDDPDPASANFWTPMGSALVTGHGALAPVSPNWRSRVMILMTDGLENRDPRLIDVRDALSGNPNYVPSFTENAQLGYTIHACAFGPPAQVDTGAIQALVIGGDGHKSYNGQLHSTETTSDAGQAFALKEHFLSLLADTLPVEVVGPFASNFTIEPGVSELICVVSDAVAFTVTPPPEHMTPIPAVNTQPGFSWVRISNPAPGAWSLGGFAATATVQGFAIVDLMLQTTFDAGRTDIGVGLPIPLTAEIRENGVGVHGATVSVDVEGPFSSIGQILTDYTRTPVFNLARWKELQARPARLEPLNLRRQMLVAASQEAALTLRHVGARVTLTETATPGRYEGAWLNTLEEGTYTFRFRARGQTASGDSFQRDYVISRHLEPVPEPTRTTLTWTSIPIFERKIVRWIATLVPQTATGRPLGPGLEHKLSFQVAGRAAATPMHSQSVATGISKGKSSRAVVEQNNLIQVTDNLDGTYSAELELPIGQVPPPLSLRFGARRIPLLSGATLCRRVQITLKRIKVLDDHETWFPSPGEMSFDVVAAPNSDPGRAMRRRLPSGGYIRLSDGQSEELNLTVYDAYLEDGATLDFSIGGTEYDWLLFFTRKDPMARYRRLFTGGISSWAGSYKPDDEPDDPESLRDWQLWYEVEVF